ncbi:hypothetical protein COL32_27740 [Bacillus pseudomycoides]|uniref:hypothetical protein n=1 Tax=Bacillus pseudomycoides TaxID=64104 RepID=UPI000BF762DB|nr:hypothetical protein [Bacillus pseudomycoides]PFW87218.1 hypothetical protein COL29_29685 [Bacillus pseudomycoides]PFX37083.1 hypothetical protein COL32_27740 [Bacillus pseudomycoides]
MQMNMVTYQVLLPQKFWKQAKSEKELNQMIEHYFSVGYPNYVIREIIESGESHIAICVRED